MSVQPDIRQLLYFSLGGGSTVVFIILLYLSAAMTMV